MNNNQPILAEELYSDLCRVIGSVDMCQTHHDQLISKLKLYLNDRKQLFEIILNNEKSESGCCGSGSCKCKGGE